MDMARIMKPDIEDFIARLGKIAVFELGETTQKMLSA
jgi:hypothetical protein